MTRTESVCTAAIQAYLATVEFTPAPTVYNSTDEVDVVPRVWVRVQQGEDMLPPLGAYELAVTFGIVTDVETGGEDAIQAQLEHLFLESDNYMQPLVQELSTYQFGCNGLVQGEGVKTDVKYVEGANGLRRETTFGFSVIGSDLTRFQLETESGVEITTESGEPIFV